MPNTVRVAASASVAALAGLFALPLYIIAVGWLVMSLPNHSKDSLSPVRAEYSVQTQSPTPQPVNAAARDEKKFEAFGDCSTGNCSQVQNVGWRLFRRPSQQTASGYPSRIYWEDQRNNQPITPTQTKPATASPKPAAIDDPEKNFHEKKTGAVRCECCKKTMVGERQKTYWTDANQPLTYLCVDCAGTLPQKEREKVMESWLARVAPTLTPAQKAQYMAAIR